MWVPKWGGNPGCTDCITIHIKFIINKNYSDLLIIRQGKLNYSPTTFIKPHVNSVQLLRM